MKKDLFKTFFFRKNLAKNPLLYRSSQQRCLKVSPNSRENSCIAVSFLIKIQAWGCIGDSSKGFSCEFCEVFKKAFLTKHFPTNSSFSNLSHKFILQRSFIYLLEPSFVRKIDKTHNFGIFSFCKYILYYILRMHFIL